MPFKAFDRLRWTLVDTATCMPRQGNFGKEIFGVFGMLVDSS